MTKPKQGSLALHHLTDWTTDAYIKARLGQQKVRSKTHKNTSNPVFDEGFKLLVQNLELQTLRLKAKSLHHSLVCLIACLLFSWFLGSFVPEFRRSIYFEHFCDLPYCGLVMT